MHATPTTKNISGWTHPNIIHSVTIALFLTTICSPMVVVVRGFSLTTPTSLPSSSRTIRPITAGVLSRDRHSLRMLMDDVRNIATSVRTSMNIATGTVVDHTSVNDEEIRRLKAPIRSGQTELPVVERIAKTIHEESMLWLIALGVPTLISLGLHTNNPLYGSILFEGTFLSYCTIKLLFTFQPPNLPQPLLGNRRWSDVRELIWSSQRDEEERRSFLMGWFYDAPLESLRYEDALDFLGWIKHGTILDALSSTQIAALEDFDMIELEVNVNSGRALPRRTPSESPLGAMLYSMEPMRYRHKPLFFYSLTHGAFMLLTVALSNIGFEYIPARDPKTSLAYWYRPASTQQPRDATTAATATTPLVFAHGVGGMAFYYPLISDLVQSVQQAGDSAPMVLLDLPFVSLRIHDDVPTIASQVDSICDILDHHGIDKATFVGHSYGTLIPSWMVQSRPDRVANCVFMDPICFQLHLKNILYNFYFKGVDSRRTLKDWSNPASIGAVINFAGTEMHTNHAMLRHFSWATNALWPQDLVGQGISACILLSDGDIIVPSREVEDLVNLFHETKNSDNNRNGQKVSGEGAEVSVKMLQDAGHGDITMNEAHCRTAVDTISAMMGIPIEVV